MVPSTIPMVVSAIHCLLKFKKKIDSRILRGNQAAQALGRILIHLHLPLTAVSALNQILNFISIPWPRRLAAPSDKLQEMRFSVRY